MANSPDPRSTHVNILLTQISIAFQNAMSAYISHRVFPIIPVIKQSDRYATYPKDAFLRARARIRGRGSESAGDGWEVDTTNTYFANRYDFHYDMYDDDLINVDEVFDLRQDAVEFVTHTLMLTRENNWMNTYFKTGVWGIDLDGTTGTPVAGTSFLKWDEAGSDPINDITGAASDVHSATGYKPNVLVVSPKVKRTLKYHPAIRDLTKYTSGESLPDAMLARILEVDEVLEASAVVDSAAPGATPSVAFTAGKHALLAYRPMRPGIKTPSAGYTFAWKLPETGGQFNVAMKSFRMDWLESERIEGSLAYDQKLISSSLGAFFENTIA